MHAQKIFLCARISAYEKLMLNIIRSEPFTRGVRRNYSAEEMTNIPTTILDIFYFIALRCLHSHCCHYPLTLLQRCNLLTNQ